MSATSRRLCAAGLGLIFASCVGVAPISPDTAETLEAIRKNYQLPALAVIVVKDGKVCDRAAVGIRKEGDPTPVSMNDHFHIGSCTKSMTATLAAMLVEEGMLKWTTTIAEVFPELKDRIDQRYIMVTLEQLLTNRGGAPGQPPEAAWEQAWREEGTPMEQRREFIEAILREAPKAAPNTQFLYSNQGYAVAGAMLEKTAGKPWETLIAERLFAPLKMKSAGFGPPGGTNPVTEPWGHKLENGEMTPLRLDNPPAIAPAGRVHCSLDDLARYTMVHLRGEKADGILKAETFRKLHTPPTGQDYAFGWVRLERNWAGGRAFTHSGSNGMWFLTIWFAPEKDFAVISTTNVGGEGAEKACDQAASKMIDKWLAQ
jgi:CubicO group peptidase (beta-lactamase class C family)